MSQGKAIKAGVGYVIGNILIKGVTFISLPIFSWLMSTQDYGLYSTYVAYVSIITIFIGLGLPASIKNANYDFPNKMEKFVSTITLVTLFSALILTTVIFLFQSSISSFTEFGIGILVMLIIQSFGQAMLNIANMRLSIDYNYKNYVTYAGFNSIVNVLASVLLIYTLFFNDRFTGRVIGSTIPLAVLGIYLFIVLGSRGNFNVEWRMAKYALVFGFPLIWHYLAQQIESQFDRIMITQLKGASFTGIYSFTYSVANIFTVLFYSTDNVWSVWYYSRMHEKNYTLIRKKANEYMFLISILACLMMIVSRELIMIIAPEEYWEGTELFVPLIWGMFFLFLYTIPVGVEYYFRETHYIAITTFVAAIVNIITNYIFINMFTYKAAAYTTAFSYIIMFIMHWLVSKNILKKKGIKPFFKIMDFLRYIGIVVGGGIFVFVFNNYLFLKYILTIIIFLGVFILKKKQIIELVRELRGNR